MSSAAVDVHAHWFPPAIVERFDALAGRRVWPPHPASLVERVEALERADVETQLLSLGHNQPSFEDRDAAIEAARFANDAYAEAVAANSRLAAFASLPLPHADAAIAEAQRSLDDLGVAGINVGTTALGTCLDDPRFDDLWTFLDERSAAVFVHPVGSPDTFTVGMDKHLLGPKFGGPHEMGVAAIRMLVSGFPRRFPRIKWILAPMGGTLPLLWRRFEEMSESLGQPDLLGPSPREALASFFYDTTLSDDPLVMRLAIDEFGADRLLLGTDSPRVDVGDWRARIEHTVDGADERDGVIGGNARRLLAEASAARIE